MSLTLLIGLRFLMASSEGGGTSSLGFIPTMPCSSSASAVSSSLRTGLATGTSLAIGGRFWGSRKTQSSSSSVTG